MKKKNQKSALTLLIVYTFLFLCFISTMIAAQSDSTQGANGANAMEIVSQIANILPAPWGQIVSALSVLAAIIIPLVQKRLAKKKATAVVKAVLDANPTLPQQHADSLKSLTK